MKKLLTLAFFSLWISVTYAEDTPSDDKADAWKNFGFCLLYTSPSPRD